MARTMQAYVRKRHWTGGWKDRSSRRMTEHTGKLPHASTAALPPGAPSCPGADEVYLKKDISDDLCSLLVDVLTRGDGGLPSATESPKDSPAERQPDLAEPSCSLGAARLSCRFFRDLVSRGLRHLCLTVKPGEGQAAAPSLSKFPRVQHLTLCLAGPARQPVVTHRGGGDWWDGDSGEMDDDGAGVHHDSGDVDDTDDDDDREDEENEANEDEEDAEDGGAERRHTDSSFAAHAEPSAAREQLLLEPLRSQPPEALCKLTSLTIRGDLTSFAGLCEGLRDCFSAASGRVGTNDNAGLFNTTANGGANTRGSSAGSSTAGGSSGAPGKLGLKRLDLGGASFPLSSVTPAELSRGHSALAALGLEEVILHNELLPGVEAQRDLLRLGTTGGELPGNAAATSVGRLQKLQHIALEASTDYFGNVYGDKQVNAVLAALPESVGRISLLLGSCRADLRPTTDSSGKELRFRGIVHAFDADKAVQLLGACRCGFPASAAPLRLLELPKLINFVSSNLGSKELHADVRLRVPHLWVLLGTVERVVCHSVRLHINDVAVVIPRLKTPPEEVLLQFPRLGWQRRPPTLRIRIAADGAGGSQQGAAGTAAVEGVALQLMASHAYLHAMLRWGSRGNDVHPKDSLWALPDHALAGGAPCGGGDSPGIGSGAAEAADTARAGGGASRGKVLLVHGQIVADVVARGSSATTPFWELLKTLNREHAAAAAAAGAGVRRFRLLPGGSGALLLCGGEAAPLAAAAERAFRAAAAPRAGGSSAGEVRAAVLPLDDLDMAANRAYGFCLRKAIASLPLGSSNDLAASLAEVVGTWRELEDQWLQSKSRALPGPRSAPGSSGSSARKRARREDA